MFTVCIIRFDIDSVFCGDNENWEGFLTRVSFFSFASEDKYIKTQIKVNFWVMFAY